MRILCSLLLLGLAGAAHGQALPGPLAPAASGKLQCYEPNRAKKTCQSLASYQLGPKGEILNGATVLISPAPLTTMTATSTVEIIAGQVCGAMREADVAAASFVVSGKPATPEETAALRARVTEAERPMFDRRICTAYDPEGEALLATATIEGLAEPLRMHVIWVAPSDGFTVSP